MSIDTLMPPAGDAPALTPAVEASPARRRRWMLPGALLLAAMLATAAWLVAGRADRAPAYETVRPTRGTLVVTVSATGNLQPTNQVAVGSELSGTMAEVRADVNDRVRRGQVLARLDVSRLRDQIASARGNLAAAQAQVAVAGATAREARLQDDRLTRMAQLTHGGVPARSELDAAHAALQRALASVAASRAAVQQARATLSVDQTNLEKATIRSPIDGVVLTRQIEPGQTVAASLQAPVLFTLAEDLTRMELDVDVDEADVGQVHEGQPATFTVDAWPDRRYPARVRRVGFGSQTKDGVVSYLTVLTVDNADLSLRPGMTATAAIEVDRRRHALLLPATAFRYAPPASTPGSADSGGLVARLLPRMPHRPAQSGVSAQGPTRTLWILRDGKPARIEVTVGASDGRRVEITGGPLREHMAVITGTGTGQAP